MSSKVAAWKLPLLGVFKGSLPKEFLSCKEKESMWFLPHFCLSGLRYLRLSGRQTARLQKSLLLQQRQKKPGKMRPQGARLHPLKNLPQQKLLRHLRAMLLQPQHQSLHRIFVKGFYRCG